MASAVAYSVDLTPILWVLLALLLGGIVVYAAYQFITGAWNWIGDIVTSPTTLSGVSGGATDSSGGQSDVGSGGAVGAPYVDYILKKGRGTVL